LKTEKAGWGARIFSLLVLFVIITIVVPKSAPALRTSEEHQALLEVHEGIMYFYVAELMAKQIAPDPSLRWSHCLMDPHTGCLPVGNGVWSAGGTIAGPPNILPTPPNWQAYFVPEGTEPPFVRVGNMASGDANAFLKRIREVKAPAQGERGEK
jgi:hypothetical protein